VEPLWRVRACGRLRRSSLSAGVLAVLGCGSGPAGHETGGPTDAAQAVPTRDGDGGGDPASGDAGDESSADMANAPPDAGLALFDDFEETAVGSPPGAALWSVVQPDCQGSGTLAVDDTQAHSGKHSVRVNGGGGYCDHVFFANTSAVAAVGKQIYVRFFVRLDTALGAGHVTFLAMKDLADNGDDLRMGGQDMVLMYNRQSDDATLPVLSPTGVSESDMPAPQTWLCIESHVDEAAGTIDTWVDGREIAGLVENGTSVADVSTQWLSRGAWRPSLSDVRFGWESYAGQTMTLWFDDVAIAGARIGCGL
jgi:hypothetical protein